MAAHSLHTYGGRSMRVLICDDEDHVRKLYRLGFEKLAREASVVPLMTDVTNYAYRGNLDFTPPVDGYPRRIA